ncbi:MAG: pyruvate kinase, partial [Elusimicrobia bacterium]|nr:pyruvate kinase [Elusimicrobiota bacterium]
MPKTRIVCTLGPASSTETVLRKMMLAGMDVVRINFSHGNLEKHKEQIEIVRRLNKKYRRRIRILGDLEGHRIRIGRLKGHRPVEVFRRQVVSLVPRDIAGEKDVLPFDYHGDLSVFRKGHEIFIDDGNIALVVEGVSAGRLKTRVLIGGLIKERKGINAPDVPLAFRGVAPHDQPNIAFCLAEKLDFMALSFVRSRADVVAVRKLIEGAAPGPQIISKIENREGIHNIDQILDVSDGVMVARGDMGVSIPIWEVPMVQKMIIRKCNAVRKPVVTA